MAVKHIAALIVCIVNLIIASDITGWFGLVFKVAMATTAIARVHNLL